MASDPNALKRAIKKGKKGAAAQKQANPQNYLSTYEDLLGQKATQQGPSLGAQYKMQQAGLGADIEAANQAKQLMGQTGSAYGRLAAGATGARENLGMSNIGAQTQGGAGIYSGLLGNQMNLMGQDVDAKQQMLRSVMESKAATQLGSRQAEAAKHKGGLFGSGGVLGLGF